MKILVVDDEPDIRQLLSQALLVMGNHDVSVADSGPGSLAVIERAPSPFDCILLDIQMPEMTGIEVCKIVRSNPAYCFVPIIMVTAASDKDHIDEAFSVGATDYLTKPFDIIDLKNRIALAEKSAFQSQRLSSNASSLEELQHGLEKSNFHALTEAIPIDDVNGVLRVCAFESYLRQLNRIQFNHIKIFTVIVRNVEHIYARCVGREFADQVTDIAEAISDALCGKAPFISYLGSGFFVLAVCNQYVDDVSELQINIEDALHSIDMVYRNGDPVVTHLDVAEVLKPGSFLSASNKTKFIENLFHSRENFIGQLTAAGSVG